MRWWLLQIAIVCGMVWLVDDPKLSGAAAIYGIIIALIVTGLLSRLLDWLATRKARPSERREPNCDGLSLPRSGRHPGNGPKLIDRRRIGEKVR